MPRTEQLNIRITPSEKEALVAEATRSNLKVSDYVRKRLLGLPLTDTDQLLLEGLATLGPQLRTSLAEIEANMREIAKLRREEECAATECSDPAPATGSQLAR